MVQTSGLKSRIVVVTGPTASGKTEAALRAAEFFDGEIVNADSMQIYRRMDIGTAKPTPEERRGIPHHLLDVAEPGEDFSAERFAESARAVISEIVGRKKLPIIAGGTGLYISALLGNLNFAGAIKNEKLREYYSRLAAEQGAACVYDRLCAVDQASASKIHPSDLKRVIRALEIYETTGRTKSESAKEGTCPYDYLLLILEKERRQLYDDINNRVEKMFADGLTAEAEALLPYVGSQAAKAIGYRETLKFLKGEASLEECKELIKTSTRHYAKRQMTYFRGMKQDKIYVGYADYDRHKQLIKDFLQ